MSKITNVVVGAVLASVMASGCISVHKKEEKNVPRTVEHDTVVVP
jgi:hypothetical protein